MLLLRVQLPDRPGSLGAVATAMGTVGADISAIEIVEKGANFAINDFMLTMPPGGLPDGLVSACNQVEGVRVLWLSRYPESWGIESDIDAVDRMTAAPDQAVDILTQSAPKVFHCQWALAIDGAGTGVAQTELAPDVTEQCLAAIGSVDESRTAELADGWVSGWGETIIALAPLPNGGAVILGRQGGPHFLASELRRLQHLATLIS